MTDPQLKTAETERMALTPKDQDDLRWYFREARGAVAGLGAQGYEPSFGGDASSDDSIVQAFGRVSLARRATFVEGVRDQMCESEGGGSHWRVLGWVHGWPRRDDPWQDFAREPEIAALIRYAPSLRLAASRTVSDAAREEMLARSWRASQEAIRAGASPVAEAERIYLFADRIASVHAQDEDVGAAAVRAWEIACRSPLPPKKDPALCLRAREEAREMYAGAADAYRAAKLVVAAVSRRGRKAEREAAADAEVGKLGFASMRLLNEARERKRERLSDERIYDEILLRTGRKSTIAEIERARARAILARPRHPKAKPDADVDQAAE